MKDKIVPEVTLAMSNAVQVSNKLHITMKTKLTNQGQFLMRTFQKQLFLSDICIWQDLYREGARKFLIVNIPSIGCLPAVKALASSGPLNSTDKIGCMRAYNDLVDIANLGIEKILSELSSKLQRVHISIGDLYGFIKEAIRHPAKYGIHGYFFSDLC